MQWQLSGAAVSAAVEGSSAGGGDGSGAEGEGSPAEPGSSANVDLEGESVSLQLAITVANSGSSSSSSSGGSSSSNGSNSTGMAASTSVLLFMRLLDGSAQPGLSSNGSRLPLATISSSGCSWAGNSTDVVQQLVGFARTSQLAPGASERLTFQLQLSPPAEGYSSSAIRSSWTGFGDPEPPCGLYGLRFGHDQPDAALVLLD